MALATVGPNGEPQVAAVFFAAVEAMNLYWVSMPGTRHGAAAVATGRASAAVYPDSGKMGFWPGDERDNLLVRRESAVDYYDGEL